MIKIISCIYKVFSQTSLPKQCCNKQIICISAASTLIKVWPIKYLNFMDLVVSTKTTKILYTQKFLFTVAIQKTAQDNTY